MAPEQAGGQAVDHRCDLFSLGCVLYQMCTGDRPFHGNNTIAILSALARHEPPPPVSLNLEVPTELSELVMQLLAKKPEQRPQSAEEVVQALREIEGQTTVALPPPETRARKGRQRPTAKPGKGSRRWPWLVGGGVLVVGMLAVLSFFFLGGSGPEPPSQGRQPPETSATANGPAAFPPHYTNSQGMEFVLIPKGKFWMGGGGGRPGTKEVEIPYDFYLGKYEVTQEEWQNVTGLHPSNFSRSSAGKDAVKDITFAELQRFPVENVSWGEAQAFAERVNAQEKDSGWLYRLPTEVEWEYSCRGGPASDPLESSFDFYLDAPSNLLSPDQANFKDGGLKRTCKVGSYRPNRLGLYDMHGNVWEWCADELPADPKDPKGASQRLSRGGSWIYGSGLCRAAYRLVSAPSQRNLILGLRLARVPVGTKVK
jgi:formylglycine-generating enzyme required for sulfatase activity